MRFLNHFTDTELWAYDPDAIGTERRFTEAF
jgi:hypothetical protein